MIDIAELKRLEAERTQGIWTVEADSGICGQYWISECIYGGGPEEINAAFIAFMANNAKAIIEEIERLRRANEMLYAAYDLLKEGDPESEVRQENARLREGYVQNIGKCNTTHSACDCVIKTIRQYGEALKWYADSSNYEGEVDRRGYFDPAMFHREPSAIDDDQGAKAREALGG